MYMAVYNFWHNLWVKAGFMSQRMKKNPVSFFEPIYGLCISPEKNPVSF